MELPRRASFLLPISVLTSCVRGNTPDAVAREFIDHYYIERDHARALKVASGGAAERVRSEQQLLSSVPSAGGGVQPRVFYSKESEQQKGEDTELTFGLTIDSSGFKLNKRVRLRVRKEDDQHKVVFFDEQDVPSQ